MLAVLFTFLYLPPPIEYRVKGMMFICLQKCTEMQSYREEETFGIVICSFIHSFTFFSIYPSTGENQGCGNCHICSYKN